MVALPVINDFIDTAVTQDAFKTAFTSLHNYLTGMFGTTGVPASARTALGLGDAAVATVASIVAQAAIPTGTIVPFFQATAPTGWTQITTQNDKVLRVVDGTVGFIGGSQGGSWTITGVTVDGISLTIAQMPAHSHEFTKDLDDIGTFAQNNGVGTTQVLAQTSLEGGGQTHDHPFTSDGTWRPAFIDVIIASKDAP